METGSLKVRVDDQVLTDLQKVQKDLLWGEYTELRNQVRHVELVRTNAINFAMLLTSALIAVITLDRAIDRADLGLCLVITGVGLFSAVFSVLYLDRYVRNAARASYVRHELDRLFFSKEGLGLGLSSLRDAGEAEYLQHGNAFIDRVKRITFRGVGKVFHDSHLFWIAMPTLILIAGILLTVISASPPK
jgi:hypothetical protein